MNISGDIAKENDMETTVSLIEEEEDDLRGLDMDLPDLPEECKYVTEMERETGKDNFFSFFLQLKCFLVCFNI